MFVLLLNVLFVFRLHPRQSDEDGGEHREHHRLDEAHQAFEAHHEDAHDDAQARHGELHGNSLSGHEEDDTRDSHRDGMTGHHVGEKSDHQGEGLGEDTYKLDDGNDGYRRLQPRWHVGPEDVLPVVLVARELHDEEGAEGQEEGHGNVARHIS